MDKPTLRRVRQVFMEVVDLPVAERGDALDRACAGDSALRSEVQSLLDAEARAGAFLAEPTAGALGAEAANDPRAGGFEPAGSMGTPTRLMPTQEGPGTRIGPYKLLQLIGEGGFGSVFMAEQEKPVLRRVALKIIKLGMDTRAIIARFEAERQALALMDHPHIARVLDAGATETGRPYFVMELVKGDPIGDYCDKQRLSIKDRLELFVQVCAAIQHAHNKGIIHRDIKPSNVLVSTQDGRPHAKVIDFGIAKATASKLTEKTLFTEHGALIGTPEYMSPEQAEGSLDIDTRTDVYSLGVLLYELITGTTPFRRSNLRSAAYGEIQRIIREVEPEKPSTRISENFDLLVNVATQRNVEPKKLGLMIRGDLDWIVMRALEKDRQRRYETANGFAMDIRRYLTGEAVLAAPPSAAYRTVKFVRRNRLQVAAAGLILIALLLGLAGTAWQAKVASDRAEAARQAEAEAKTARDAERMRANELEQVSQFQEKMLSQVDPTTAGVWLTEDVNRRFVAALVKANVPEDQRGNRLEEFEKEWAHVNATDAAAALIDETILKPAVKAIDEQFKGQPVVDAKLRQVLADRYVELGLYEAAMPLQVGALATRRRELGNEHLDTLRSIDSLGVLLLLQRKLDPAETNVREVLEIRRRLQGEVARDTLFSYDTLAQILAARGDLESVVKIQRDILTKSRRVLGDDDPDTIRSINNLASGLQSQKEFVEAEGLYREAMERYRRVNGENHKSTLAALNNIGSVLKAQGKLEEAETAFREALAKRRRSLGDDHPTTRSAINNVASVLESQRKFAEAEPFAREAMEKAPRLLGEAHLSTLMIATRLGDILYGEKKYAEAEPYLRRAVEGQRRLQGVDHPDTNFARMMLSSLLMTEEKFVDAEPLNREILESSLRSSGADHLTTINAESALGSTLLGMERFADAEPVLRDALERAERTLGSSHLTTLLTASALGVLLERTGRHAEAVERLEKIVNLCRQSFKDARARPLGRMLWALGRARMKLGFESERFEDAEEDLTEACPILVEALGDTHADTRACTQDLVDFYSAWAAAEPGKGYDAKAAEWRGKLAESNAPAAGTPEKR